MRHLQPEHVTQAAVSLSCFIFPSLICSSETFVPSDAPDLSALLTGAARVWSSTPSPPSSTGAAQVTSCFSYLTPIGPSAQTLPIPGPRWRNDLLTSVRAGAFSTLKMQLFPEHLLSSHHLSFTSSLVSPPYISLLSLPTALLW